MIGAIAGDVIGSAHEAAATKTKRFELFTPDSCFTDDTVMTAAVAEVLLTGGDYAKAFERRYPRRLDDKLRGVVSRFRARFGMLAESSC